MKTKQNSSIRASALQTTFSVTLISLSAALLALAADAVHWELDPAKFAAGPQRLRQVVAAGLRYPVVIDASWTATGSMGAARGSHTATLLPSGKVLVAGGHDDSGYLSSAELYGLTLSAVRRRVDGINTVRLTWNGATSANIDVYRDVAPPIATVPNTGS